MASIRKAESYGKGWENVYIKVFHETDLEMVMPSALTNQFTPVSYSSYFLTKKNNKKNQKFHCLKNSLHNLELI